ncbi:MAG: hypothetical protein R3F54_30805 [Alphaproteobacteria bacterium]
MEQEALRELYYWMLAILVPLAIGITIFLVRRGEFDWRLLNSKPRFPTHEEIRPIWDPTHYLYDAYNPGSLSSGISRRRRHHGE